MVIVNLHCKLYAICDYFTDCHLSMVAFSGAASTVLSLMYIRYYIDSDGIGPILYLEPWQMSRKLLVQSFCTYSDGVSFGKIISILVDVCSKYTELKFLSATMVNGRHQFQHTNCYTMIHQYSVHIRKKCCSKEKLAIFFTCWNIWNRSYIISTLGVRPGQIWRGVGQKWIRHYGSEYLPFTLL